MSIGAPSNFEGAPSRIDARPRLRNGYGPGFVPKSETSPILKKRTRDGRRPSGSHNPHASAINPGQSSRIYGNLIAETSRHHVHIIHLRRVETYQNLLINSLKFPSTAGFLGARERVTRKGVTFSKGGKENYACETKIGADFPK